MRGYLGRNRRGCSTCLFRPALVRRGCCRGSTGRRHRPARRQTARGHPWFRPSAPALGGGVVFRLGDALAPSDQKLRAIRLNTRGLPSYRLRRIDAQASRKSNQRCIAPFNGGQDGSAETSDLSVRPTPIDQDFCAQSRSPIDMMVHGCSTSLFQA